MKNASWPWVDLMRIELHDIIGNEHVYSSLVPPPPDTSLGDIFASDDMLRQVAACVSQVRVNGVRIDNWRNVSLTANDTLIIDITPKEIFSVISTIVSIISAILSTVQFFIGLFNKPKTPKSTSGYDRPTQYSWEGINTRYQAGGVVPITYGEHRTGGQMLMATIDIAEMGHLPITSPLTLYRSGGLNRKQQLNMLVGWGEGPVTEVSCLEVNGVALTELPDVSLETQVGSPIQSSFVGFDQIRNTFRDGREFTDAPIVYRTQGVEIDQVQLQIAALEGLVRLSGEGKHPDRRLTQTVRYTVDYKHVNTTGYAQIADVYWTGDALGAHWDAIEIDFGSRSEWDVKLTWQSATSQREDWDKWKLWLQNVTEITETTPTFSHTAVSAVKAIATSQLNGGLPQISAMLRGRNELRAYQTPTAYVTSWTANPAWCVLDYMTNSRYGMGAFVDINQINIQSFIDFATLCDTLVPDGLGGTEKQHRLDLVMDQKKPHREWIDQILGNYRSALIYSQQQYKIISDRDDLPLRQVFHAGNTIPSRTQVRIAPADPLRPNQANVSFSNAELKYERDVLYVQNSASVYGNNDPIKDIDIALWGISRESEAIREAKWQLDRRRQTLREVTWATGLEGVAVELGDKARVGIITTDYEFGYGGRVLDGSANHIVLDREVTIHGDKTYDMYVWHTAADTPESRTLATTPGIGNQAIVTAVASPASAFQYACVPGDRWAIGVTSEDLVLVRVKSVKRDEQGVYEFVGEEYISQDPSIPDRVRRNDRTVVIGNTIVSPEQFLNSPPPQPYSINVHEEQWETKDGNYQNYVLIDVTPHPPLFGGATTATGAVNAVTLATSHTPVDDALVGMYLQFNSGVSSGVTTKITNWNYMTRVASVAPAFASPPASGDPYTLIAQAGVLHGFDVDWRTSTDSGWTDQGPFYGTRAIIPAQYNTAYVFRITPFNDRGLRNYVGRWSLLAITMDGDLVAPDAPTSVTITPGIQLNLIRWTIPTDPDLDVIEVWRSTSNDSSGATKLGETRGISWVDDKLANDTIYYYWLKSRDKSGNTSGFHATQFAGNPGTTLRIATDDIDDGAIASAKLTEQAQRFATDISFTASDNETMAWSSGTIALADGTTYAIDAGDTGSMTALTYVYLNTAVSSTVLQTTTTYSSTVGETKILVGVGKNIADADQYALVIPVIGVFGLNESVIQANAVTANTIAANAITTAKLNAGAVTAAKIAAAVIDSSHLRTDTAVISVAAQIANAIITNAHIASLSADKLTAGTISAALSITSGNVVIDGLNSRLYVIDGNGTTRVILGRISGASTDYGLQVYNAAGQIMHNFDSGTTTVGIGTNAITQNQFYTNSNDTSAVGGEEIEVASISITTVGGPVFLILKIEGTLENNGNGTLTLYRGALTTGTVLDTTVYRDTASSTPRSVVACAYIDTPAAGTYAYRGGWDQNDNGVARYRRLQAVELKR